MSEVISSAFEFWDDHQAHVNRLIETARAAVAPTGSDAYRPELWKACHWLWFHNTYC